jgi:hypothetical protein
MPTAPHSRSELDLSKVDWHRIDGTGEEAIVRQTAEDPDTAPVLTPEEILAVGRRIATDEVEDVRALRIPRATHPARLVAGGLRGPLRLLRRNDQAV